MGAGELTSGPHTCRTCTLLLTLLSAQPLRQQYLGKLRDGWLPAMPILLALGTAVTEILRCYSTEAFCGAPLTL